MNLTLYHGSPDIVEHPYFGGGKPYNDYGIGFYCTERLELAKEWACTEEHAGYANRYQLDMNGLSVCKLNSREYHILNWLAILAENRNFSLPQGLPSEAKDYLIETFLPDYRSFDVITGYRADDSYFAFAKAFLSGTLSLEQLSAAMRLGKLGEQVVIKSEKAFNQLNYVEAIPAEYEAYLARRRERDAAAKDEYRQMAGVQKATDAVYMLDILRQQWKNDDARLR